MAYTDKQKTSIINTVCDNIEKGLSLRKALLLDGMPNRNTFYEWIDNDETKLNQYARATEIRADLIFEDILHIADDTSKDHQTVDLDGVEITSVNNEVIQRSRLRVDSRKWILSKMQPKKYGDKLDVTSGNEKLSNPILSVDPLSSYDKDDNSTTED